MNFKMKKLVSGIAAVALTATLASPITSKAAGYENPSKYEINRLLTEAAMKYDVPAEVVKALAAEESGWKQFTADGEPNISGDGGIGIMQVTNTDGYDVERLKSDIAFNIEAGIKILNKKWELGEKGLTDWDRSTSIPTVGDNERDIIENWYFTILAYNGQVQTNSPIKMATGERNFGSYQDRVYAELSSGNPGIFPNDVVEIPFAKEDFTYTGDPNFYLLFNKKQFEVDGLSHTTRHSYQPGDLVISANGSKFREGPSSDTKEVSTKLPAGETEVLEILKGFEYDTSKNPNHFVWYDVEREDNKQEAYVASSELNKIGERLSGIDRIKTAVDISQAGWNQADTVVLAQGYNFPDALTGGPLAYKKDAPLLLTDKTKLTESTKNEIQRLKASKVIILGGEGAVGKGVKDTLTGMGLKVDRIGGIDRYETAKRISEQVAANPDKAIIASGKNFPDALSVAPYASVKGYPILLTAKESVSEYTTEALNEVDGTIVVGGEGVISNTVMKKVKGEQRVSGIDRYETSLEIARKLPLSNPGENVLVASGKNYPDALSGSVLAAKQQAPLLLSNPEQLPTSVNNYILSEKYKEFFILGGPGAINVEDELGDLYKKLYY
ncbi:cell wall-binding repeat-containing protein [Rossellomorea vietnamensis]|uniref:cell wall-binding repeat-containing protein n=1 Tax=Rossellomorea vietnamensis TaxID=218284 RepID=UPI001CCCC634|nr:cell wall-binding repeat-containing protein [Rossellomorea vietnamensis]MCA0150327.1 cell wall-binding repeat-containing protein [Rossellomorea vietnamensis]